jgi:hypothetical protein
MGGRFQHSVDAMDANAWDADGRWRLSTYAKTDYAFWNALLQGWVGWAMFAVCLTAFAGLLYWLFA